MNSASEAGALHQYTGVSIKGRGILIEGQPGCGKTSLALALIDRGATLIGDDGVRLEEAKTCILAHPPSRIRGKIEIRGVGLCDVPCTSAPVSLILSLAPDAPRFVEQAEAVSLLGIAIPRLAFTAGGPVDAIRAEYALKQHGMPIPHEPVR